MQKHPNAFSRRLIERYFQDRQVAVEITEVPQGYVVFFPHFSVVEGCLVDDPAAKILYDRHHGTWELYWISGTFRWHLYDRYASLPAALDEVYGERASDLFHKVL